MSLPLENAKMSQKPKFSFVSSLRYEWKTLARKIRLTALEEDDKEGSDEEPELQEKGKLVDPGREKEESRVQKKGPREFRRRKKLRSRTQEKGQEKGETRVQKKGPSEFRRRKKLRSRTQEKTMSDRASSALLRTPPPSGTKPAETSSFGDKTQNTANTSLFGANVQVFGAFGTTGTQWPGFRWFATNTSTSVSGAITQNQIGGLFGAKPAMPAFYKTPDTSFAHFTGSGLSQTKPAQRHRIRMDARDRTTRPGGALGQASAPGTAHVKYSPVEDTDVVIKGPDAWNINVKIHCITSMKEYENKSLEELRLEDYSAGRKGTPLEGGFAAQTQEARFAYSGSSGALGQASAPGTARVKYSPVEDTDVVIKGPDAWNINVKIHCITSMKEYENKSLEELRLEDYSAGRKGTPSEGGFAAPTQEARSAYSGSSGALGQASAPGTAYVKYSPVVDTDVVIKGGDSRNINVKIHCITSMKEYKNKSLEELRLEDYTAGRKGTPSEGGFAAQTQEARSSYSGSSGALGTAYVKYSPVDGTDVVIKGTDSWNIKVKLHCITCMKEYENKSLEELRLEDYTAGRKGTPSEGGFAAQTQEARSAYSGSSKAFGQASTPGTAYVKYSPVDGTDVVIKSTDSWKIKVKLHCITCMKEYKNKSLEELRLEDYTAGRKGTPSEGGFAAQTQEARSAYSGSTPRTPYTGTNDNQPPLTFHSVHGEGVRVSSDGTIARGVQEYSKYGNGIAFSARPVKVHEKVCLCFVKKPMPDGFIRFGFTNHDPATLAQHALLDLADKPGNWAYVVRERFSEEGNILQFYVNYAGDVHLNINGEDEGLFFTGVDTRNPLWALVVVHGKRTAVQFVDPMAPNQVRRQNQSPVDEDRLEGSSSSLCVNEPLPPLRYANPLVPLSLHRTKGRNIQFVNDSGVAARVDGETGQGYVFTARPMLPGQTIVVEILSTESGRDAGILSFGLTSCDPASLSPCDLPADAELLLDRLEYWVLQRDAEIGLGRGDELAVTLTMDGEVRVSRNESTPVTVMHVDHTVRLWAFFDIGGATQKVRMLTSPPQQLRVSTGNVAPLAPIQASSQHARSSSRTQHNCTEQVRMPNHEPRLERILDRPSTSRHQPGYSDIGEASRTPYTGTNDNQPPLTFHSVHGRNVRVSSDGTIARRVKSFCGGVAFSARPVMVNEKVCLRYVETTKSWIGAGIYFGFSSHDPVSLNYSLPECPPPASNKAGIWAKFLGKIFCEKENILHYYVNSAGDVHLSNNGEDIGLFFTGVDTRNTLWALVYLSGNGTAVQFADPRAPIQVRRPNERPLGEDRLVGSMRSLSVDEHLPPPRYVNLLVPLSLHRTKGRNIQFANDRGVAARVDAEFCQGYVFTARPIRPGQTIVVQILSTESGRDSGILSFGLTSCDPASLRPSDLPADAEFLLDRLEYWVLQRDAEIGLRRGDELAVTLTMDGEVTVSRNGSTPVTVMHVDHTVRLWAFFDICGATQKVRMLTTEAVTSPPQQLRESTGTVAPLAPIQASSRCCSTTQHNCNEQVRMPNHEPRLERILDRPSTSRHQPGYSDIGERKLREAECTICYENPIDSALYTCGHMCMCYKCAVQQWKGIGSGQCPQCRAEIVDVLRVYKP